MEILSIVSKIGYGIAILIVSYVLIGVSREKMSLKLKITAISLIILLIAITASEIF